MMSGHLRTIGLFVAIVGGAVAVYSIVFTEPSASRPVPDAGPTPAPAAAPAPAAPPAFVITEISGPVEVRSEDAWRPARAGERLAVDAAVRTGAGGAATLRNPGGDEVALRERAWLEVRALDATVTALTLARGKIRAAPAPSAPPLRVSSGSAQAVGPGGSRFSVYADSRGGVAVAAHAGDVAVSASGSTVTLPAETQTYVPAGGAPASPVAIPEVVFLSVNWPEPEVHASRATLAGRTRPGTIVMVNGAPAPVGADGSFRVELSLSEGRNRVEVGAETIGGQARTVTRNVVSHTAGPPLTVDPSRIYDPPGRDRP